MKLMNVYSFYQSKANCTHPDRQIKTIDSTENLQLLIDQRNCWSIRSFQIAPQQFDSYGLSYLLNCEQAQSAQRFRSLPRVHSPVISAGEFVGTREGLDRQREVANNDYNFRRGNWLFLLEVELLDLSGDDGDMDLQFEAKPK